MSDLDVDIRRRLAMAAPEASDVRKLTRALAAVLDLHYAANGEQIEPDGGASWGKICVECDTEALGSWPCPTVRAIAEKLGVEVP